MKVRKLIPSYGVDKKSSRVSLPGMKKYKLALVDADHICFDFDKASEEALSSVLAEHGTGWENGMYADYKRINVQCWTEHEQGLINRDTLVYERFRRYFDFRNLDL